MKLSRTTRSLALSAALGLTACASTPIDTGDGVTLLPLTAAGIADGAGGDDAPIEGSVLWGGVVLGVSNQVDSSTIEVLAYPLNRVQRPLVGRPTEGRFVIEQPGYVESLDYAPGREITVLGRLGGTVEGRIGEATRQLPRVIADQLHLWRPGDVDRQPRFTFGLGIGIGT